nr:reverse transcriptase domain-containing protein [Tanacetum cinerariifolium]
MFRDLVRAVEAGPQDGPDDAGVADALAERDADRSKNGDDSHDSGSDERRRMPVARECIYSDFLKCQPLNFKGTKGVVSLTQWLEKMESVLHISNYTVANQVKFATCTLHENALTWWNSHVKAVTHEGNVMASKPKAMQDAIEFATELMDQKIRTLGERQAKNKKTLMTLQGTAKTNSSHSRGIMWHGPILQGHFKNNWPKLRNKNQGNQARNGNVVEGAYGVGTTGTIPNPMLSWGCTLNFLNHPLNIDLMPVKMGSFDVIIGMGWVSKYHDVIVCDEKIVRILFGNETLIVRGDEISNEHGSRLNIISCTKTQKYLLKECHVFLAHVTAKKAEDKSKELSDKGFIRPSSSPWGALILFLRRRMDHSGCASTTSN